jgi:sugar phosphate isomerase/epimerase
MEFACHTWAFSDLTLTEALGTIARLGFRYVDIGSGTSLNAPRAAAEPRRVVAEIRQDLAMFNLKVSDLYLMLPRISLADEDKRQKDIDLYKALIPFAKELGTPGITLSPGLAHGVEDEEAFDRATEALREMVSAGKEAGMPVSIEPHLDSMAQTPEATLKIVEAVPGLEITLDWAHMICQGIRQDDLLPLLPHTRHVQVRQAAKDKLQTPFDQGQVDARLVMEALRLSNYSGVVCIEYMNTPGWHGMVAVNAIQESAKMRDELRKARDRQRALSE